MGATSSKNENNEESSDSDSIPKTAQLGHGEDSDCTSRSSENKNNTESSDSDSIPKTAKLGIGGDTDSTSDSSENETNAESSASSSSANDSGILLSYICRGDVVLVEARASGCAQSSELVRQISVGLREKKPTPGWEFFELPILSRVNSSANLRGAKFHIQDEGGVCTWSIGCVYDANIVPQQNRIMAPPSIQSFMEHVERESKSLREEDYVWNHGGALSGQHRFASELAHIMNNLNWYNREFGLGSNKRKDDKHTNINPKSELAEKVAVNTLDTAKQLEEDASAHK